MRSHFNQPSDYGQRVFLFDNEEDLTKGTEWHSKGYNINKFLSEDRFNDFMQGTCSIFQSALQNADVPCPLQFDLSQYHLLIDNDYDVHLKVLEHTKLLHIDDFPISIKEVEERVSALCQVTVHAVNPFNSDRVFHYRVVRPQSNDNNPLHRDVWLEEYQDCINLYVPICGSNELSSLTLVPGSHLWSEDTIKRTLAGANVNGVQFNVPAVTETKNPLDIIRPNPGQNEVLIFSPYLLHGGANNLNTDVTRVSLELRLWRKQS